MKALGWILVVGGFLWLSTAPVFYAASTRAAWSDLVFAVHESKPLEPETLRQKIDAMRAKLERQRPWVFTPACMMFFGAILLSQPTRRTTKQDATNVASSEAN